jgi:hypothetical protein
MRWAPVLAAVLAGCAAPAAEVLGPAEPAPATLPWGARDCAFAIVGVRVEAARLAPYLPEGFEPAQGLLPQLPPPGPRFATLALDVYQCAAGEGVLEAGGPVAYGSFYTPVTPPPEHRAAQPGVASFVKWDTLVQNASGREVLEAAGLPAHDGEGTVVLTGLPLGGPVRARLAFEAGGFDATGTLAGPLDPPVEVPYVEFTPTASGGLATWSARATIEGALGPAHVRLAPGSWVAEVVGSDQAPGTVYAGRWSIHHANVTLPAG